MYRVAKFLSFSPPKSTKIIFFPPKAYFRALAMWSTFCENLVMIAAAIDEKGTIYTWGPNMDGQLGQGDFT